MTENYDVRLTYDATGFNRKVTGLSSAVSRVATQWASGAGQVIKRLEEGSDIPSPTPVYYLHSTALGGLVVAELNHQGAKTLGKIYLGDTLTAEHGESWGSGWVEWKHEDPVTGQRGVSDAIRYYVADDAILDPTGINIGPPTLLYPEEGAADERAPVALYGSGIPNGRCMWDGITVDCAEVERVHDWTRSL